MKKKNQKELKPGAPLHYVGKGFLGYDPADRVMTFVRNDDKSLYDIYVLYKGREMLVKQHEVQVY